MSILIKGMAMPKNGQLFLSIDEKGQVYIYGEYPTKLYQAIKLPPHGRLIDAGVLCELCDIMADKCDETGVPIWNQFRTTVECSPTIIETEGKDANT